MIETAHEHDRPFGEAGVFGDEGFVFDELELGGLGGGVGCFADGGHAGGRVEHHLVGEELGFVVSERLDLEWGVAMKAVAARGLAGRDARDLERDHFAVEQADDGVQRTDPLEGAGAPPHGFRPGEFGQHIGDDLGHDLGGFAARLFDAREVVVAFLLIVDDFGFVDGGEAGGLQKSGEGLFGGADAGAFALVADGGRDVR